MVKSLKLLIVDDDEADRMAINRAVSRSSLEAVCDEARNGAEAAIALESSSYDCVLLDYRLPDTDGLSLVKELRQANVKIPLIVLTGQGDEQVAVDLMKAGASDYLIKSKVSSNTLAPLLRSALRLFEAERKTELAYQKLQESNELLRRQNQELETQRKKIHLQNLQLIEASRLKSEFLSTISHELRTPLNAIIGFSQLLARQYPDPLTSDQLDMVNRILGNGKNLLALFNDVLDFSKIEANRMELTCELFDVEHLATTTAYELQSLADRDELNLVVQSNLEDPRVVGDRQRVHQILINLLSNAIKFSKQGTVRIEINPANVDSFELAICDCGIGIPEDKLDRIFEAFLQVDQTTKRRYKGTGLGLAIVHSLVEMMQGSISVKSQLGQGSEFRVILPRNVSSASAA